MTFNTCHSVLWWWLTSLIMIVRHCVCCLWRSWCSLSVVSIVYVALSKTT